MTAPTRELETHGGRLRALRPRTGACSRRTRRRGCRGTSSRGWCCRRCWCRRAWRTPSWPGCRRSPACTPRSSACWATRCSGRPGCWCSAPTPRSDPMIAATIAPLMLADGDPARAVALASLLAVIVGVVMVVAGLAGFGFVADLLSKPTQIGYMNGLALTIVVGQLPKLFGFSVDADGLIAEFSGFVSGAGRRRGQRDRGRDRARFAGRHPAAAAAAAQDAGRPRRRRARVARRQRVRPGGRTASTRSACCPKASRRSPSRPSSWSDMPPLFLGALAISAGRPRRHHVDGLVVRRPPRRAGARQPGDDRHRRGEHRRRLVPGLPGQHERVPHRRRGAGRFALAGHRRRRRRRDHARAGLRHRR